MRPSPLPDATLTDGEGERNRPKPQTLPSVAMDTIQSSEMNVTGCCGNPKAQEAASQGKGWGGGRLWDSLLQDESEGAGSRAALPTVSPSFGSQREQREIQNTSKKNQNHRVYQDAPNILIGRSFLRPGQGRGGSCIKSHQLSCPLFHSAAAKSPWLCFCYSGT